MPRRIVDLALAGVLALSVLVVGHNLVFLLTYGAEYGAALVRTGHDGRWDQTVRGVLIAAILAAAAAALRLAYLLRRARLVKPMRRARSGPSIRAYFRALLPLWAGLFLVSLALFVFQENYERWSAGANLPGLGVLLSFGPAGPVIVFLAVSLVAASVAALFQWGIATLDARIAASERAPRAASRAERRRADPLRPASSILGRNLAGRAPPHSLPA